MTEGNSDESGPQVDSHGRVNRVSGVESSEIDPGEIGDDSNDLVDRNLQVVTQSLCVSVKPKRLEDLKKCEKQ